MVGRDSSEKHPAIRRIWLARHGLTAWNIQQRFAGQNAISLSVEGRVQARWQARYLRDKPIAAVYTSDLGRARETAEIIVHGRAQPLVIQASPAWRELDFGNWDGLTYAEIAEAFPEQLDFFTDPEHYAPPAGETLLQLQQRVLAALTQIRVTGEGDVLLVSHGGPLRVLLSTVLGMPLARQWQLALAPGSLSALDLLPGSDLSAPPGTLALLNVQRSPLTRTARGLAKASKR